MVRVTCDLRSGSLNKGDVDARPALGDKVRRLQPVALCFSATLVLLAYGNAVAAVADDLLVETLQVNVNLDNANTGYFNSPIYTYKEHIYIAFVEPKKEGGYQTTVAKWDGDRWEHEIVEPNNLYDPYHAQPSIALDSDGYVHVTYNMHSSPWQYSVSEKAENITTWKFRGQELSGPHQKKESAVVTGPGTADIPGNRITYQYMTTDRRGTLFVVFREALKTSPGVAYAQRQWSMGIARYDVTKRTWQRVGPGNGVFPFATEPGRIAQGAHISFDRGNRMHVSWNWYVDYSLGGGDRPNEISYAYSADGGVTFRNASGKPLSLPVTMKGSDRVIGPDHFFGYTSVMATSNGLPFVLIMPMETSGYKRSVVRFDDLHGWAKPIVLPEGATSFVVADDGTIVSVSSGLRVHVSRDFGRTWSTAQIEVKNGPYDHWLDRAYFATSGKLRILGQSRKDGNLSIFTVTLPTVGVSSGPSNTKQLRAQIPK